MDILYHDSEIAVCVKPPRVLSTDEAGGMPSLVRAALGGEARTVHRLDAAVGGLMVLARNAAAAGELSRQIRDGEFHKAYLAVVHGELDARGTLRDLLWRDKARRMTFVTDTPGKGVSVGTAVFLAADWRVLAVAVVFFALAAFLSRKVSLGSLAAAVSGFAAAAYLALPLPRLLLVAFTMLLVILRHRENIIRLVRGTEPDFTLGSAKRRRADESRG